MSWSLLLPDTSGAYEWATMEGAEAQLPIPIPQLVDPASTTLPFLPFVAVHNGVKLWFDDWSEARKRAMAADWELPDLVGTRIGLRRFLAYVDAELISAVAHPRRFVAGLSAVGVQPLQFPAFTARYLFKVRLLRHVRGCVTGRGTAGNHAAVPVDLEPIRRAKIAATVSKGPGTQYTATFAHRRRPRFDEMQFGMGFDDFIDRTSL
ncbi:phage tail protein [Bosea sp. TAB14]|uniref:phage tail protein n=1 Tax=Bosea sp. TAB14 TaxID=3237481 RepID=UPI003F923E81